MKLLIVILLVLLAMATTFLAGYNYRLQVTPCCGKRPQPSPALRHKI